MRGQQWIRLNIHIKEDQLEFNLSNSKPIDIPGINNKKGIGLANVQKRLELLYPGKHFLKIESTGDTFNVHLQLNLQQVPVTDHTYKLIPELQTA
jgi:LytS/YehU family sensor histidine kinase